MKKIEKHSRLAPFDDLPLARRVRSRPESMMRTAFSLILFFVAATSSASTLIYNVRGYTLEGDALVQFYALEYDRNLVTARYATEEAAKKSTAQSRVNGRGLVLLPGLIDAHGHVAALGVALDSADLTGAQSEEEAAERLREIKVTSKKSWVFGGGWNQTLWDGGEFPNRNSLDRVIADQPVVLTRVDHHALWVNSRALEVAGITNETPDPVGGVIVRDEHGVATGVLIDNAMNLVDAAAPKPTLLSKRREITRSARYLASIGITAVHDAGATAVELDAYESLLSDGELPIRVYAMLRMADPDMQRKFELGPWEDEERMYSARSVKIYTDGALGSRGAALLEEYSDDPGNRGYLLNEEADLAELMLNALNQGYQLNVHAIGDRANTLVLDKFEALNQDSESRLRRHRIEHAQVLQLSDINRFRDLGIIASIQPTHATSDKNMAGDRLGEARLEGAYLWKTLLEAGARLAGGSDFPVEPPNPFYGLHAAVTREDRNGDPLGGWRPDERLSRKEALSLFTTDAAYAGHAEDFLGQLSPGYAADFILVRDDYFEVPARNIWRNQVEATVVAGRLVFKTETSPIQ
ncbi:MAG: amidohydrolase [Pseudomonadota bacterium]